MGIWERARFGSRSVGRSSRAGRPRLSAREWTIRTGRQGFTLVELLVGLVLLAVLSVTIFPVVVQQLERVEAVRAARDLDYLRTALRTFHVNTFAQPLYLSHLFNPITTSDSAAAWHEPSPEYRPREVSRWRGPYIDPHLAEDLRIADAVRTGFDAVIANDLYCFDSASNETVSCEPGSFLAVRVDSLIGFEFDQINDIIDGEAEPDASGPDGSRESGRLRFIGGGGIDFGLTVGVMFYLALPYTES